MDDSDQDFVDLCSKLLKRVRKKPGGSRPPRKAEHQPSSQASDADKRREADSGSQPVCTGAEEHLVCGGTAHNAGDAEPSVGPSAAARPRGLEAKDKVLHRLQQFKRASLQKMVHKDKSQPANPTPAPPLTQRRDAPHSFSAGLRPEPQDSDEALALRLQQELDREAAETQVVDLEDRGLFFCQICHRDLSHMTPEGRTQHLNRCLDESEESAPAPPPPPSGVPDCPICGRKFKSQKSRSAHLKRCSSEMGVAPAALLQALRRQTENVPADSTLAQTGGTKRKGSSKPGLPAKKKPRKKTAPLDEDAMVALALSSLLEQEQRGKRESEAEAQTNTAASHFSTTSALTWSTDTGKGRGKRKKGAVPRPLPLLLVQDAEAALARLQVRVSVLLLRSRAPSPPTPTRCPSSLPGRSGAAVLWQKSTLPPDGASTRPSDFYTPELREFIAPWESATTDAATSSTSNKPQSSVRPVSEGTPGTGAVASILPSASQVSSSQTTPSTGRALLMDLMELAEDGVTFTQCGHTASGPDKDGSAGRIPNIRLSGFVPEESEEQAVLCVSGFLPEPTHTHTEDARCRARRTTAAQPGADEERAALSSLASALSGMVNNPQLSDLQLQVDSGQVYFAHSFMLYARCPLLAEMVHESGFGVQEEGQPAAQRVLMNDVPGRAVLALLQYLYTARCSVPASLRPHVLELASRFDLQELQSLCELPHQDPATRGDEEDDGNQEENVNNRTHQALAQLLRSMWDEEDEDGEGTDTGGGRDEGRELEDDQQAVVLLADREIVNEEELEEIYEFAATQRKREEEKDSAEKVDEEEVFTEPKRSPPGLGVNKPQPNSQPEPDPGLDRSYSLLFSDCWGVYEEEDPSSLPSTSAPAKTHPPPQCQQRQSPHQPSSGPSLLQSSASVVDDLSAPPNASNLPIPGQSPGQDDLASKRERPGPRSVCEKKEPELIVLSDSSEEMEVVVGPRGPSPHSPRAVQNLQGYTQIKPQPVPKPNEPTLPNTQSSSLELGPDDPSAAPVESHPGPWCDQNPEDCSPEVSWLIPPTPVQPGRSTATSSTQTKSSVCRTQLFPRGDTSSPSVFSSPALPSATCNSPARASALYVPKSKPDETSSSDLDRRSKRASRCGASRDRGAAALPPCRPKLSSSTSSKQDTPLHVPARPYTSTPLHTELHKVPDVLATSLLDESWTSHGRDTAPSESPRDTELGSFPLSPLSDPTPPRSSSSYRGLQGSQRLGEASRQSRRSVESSSHNSAGSELKGRGLGKDEGEGEMGCENKDTGDEGEQEEAEDGEAEVAESSFQQSFMDEPPIAFNDSWGFDAVDFEASPGCFSLRLEDSGASSQQGERSLGRREAAGPASSSSTDHHPSPRSRLGSVAACSPPNAHSSRPSTGVRADTGLSFTPSPPDPTKQTTPEFTNGLLDSKIWDSWEEDEEVEALPLSQRVNPPAQLKTPDLLSRANIGNIVSTKTAQIKRRRTLVPITPLPHYSDMDTPELKNKLNRFGVRSLPKRQMILKLKQIHQYTHQLVSSEEEEEAPSASRAVQTQHPTTTSEVPANRPVSCTQRVTFKEPSAPAAIAPPKADREEEEQQLSASQGSNTSSSAASEQRSNPELRVSSDSDSDGGVSASQSANRLQDRLRAVRSFILSDSELYGQILQYRPLVLSQLQERLKATGIRLGAAKLVDYLDSQCITFTTAKPGHSAAGRRRGKRTGRGAKAAGRGRAGTALI